MTAAEQALIYQALREAASATRIEVRKKAYLELAKKMKEERDYEKNRENREGR